VQPSEVLESSQSVCCSQQGPERKPALCSPCRGQLLLTEEVMFSHPVLPAL
jgi:hypothetical protein